MSRLLGQRGLGGYTLPGTDARRAFYAAIFPGPAEAPSQALHDLISGWARSLPHGMQAIAGDTADPHVG